MWSEIERYMPEFKSGVLTGLDTDGRPFSLRCQAELDSQSETLRLDLPESVDLESGPASLLFHKHDENLWQLLSFAIRGDLERVGERWIFQPQDFIPGVGIGGLSSYLRFLIKGRKTTKQYMQKRGLERPKVPWDEWQAAFSQVREAGND